MPPAVDLLVKDAELLVVDGEREIAGGWVAVADGRIAAVGGPGAEPEARSELSAAGRIVTPGLINTHHALAGALSDPVEAWLRCGPGRAWTTVVGGRVLVDRGEPVLPGLRDALREHGRMARSMQRLA